MTNLVAESGKLFGARHYRDYHFIFALSDHVAHFGLEHHESNDSRLPERTLISPGSGMALGGLLSHEFVHSWNGKFRRPPISPRPTTKSLRKRISSGLRRPHRLSRTHACRAQRLVDPDQYHEYLASIAASLGPGRPDAPGAPCLTQRSASLALALPRLVHLAARYRLLRRRRFALA